MDNSKMIDMARGLAHVMEEGPTKGLLTGLCTALEASERLITNLNLQIGQSRHTVERLEVALNVTNDALEESEKQLDKQSDEMAAILDRLRELDLENRRAATEIYELTARLEDKK